MEIGKRIGAYDVIAKLGEGGMGVLPDRRIVTVAAAGESGEQSRLQIQVVVNWFEELRIKAR